MKEEPKSSPTEVNERVEMVTGEAEAQPRPTTATQPIHAVANLNSTNPIEANPSNLTQQNATNPGSVNPETAEKPNPTSIHSNPTQPTSSPISANPLPASPVTKNPILSPVRHSVAEPGQSVSSIPTSPTHSLQPPPITHQPVLQTTFDVPGESNPVAPRGTHRVSYEDDFDYIDHEVDDLVHLRFDDSLRRSRPSMNRSRHSVNFNNNNNNTIHSLTRSNTRINSRSHYDIRRLRSRCRSTNLSHMQLYESEFSDSEIEDEMNNNYITLDDDDGIEEVEVDEVEGRVSPMVMIQEPDPMPRRAMRIGTSFSGIPGAEQRRESRYFPGRIRKRVILKNGNVNLSPEHVDKRGRRYLQDMFTTMVDIRWRWNLLVFATGFLLSWFGFAVVWWLIAFSHHDFDHLNDESWTPCVMSINSFASTILFSIETQHTIGYGSRFTTEECPEAMFVMCLQSITGVMIQCFMVGFVFAKLSRPQKRSQTLMFSRYAIVCQRDGKLCIMFRVGDLREKSHIIGAKISAQIIRKKMTPEGENVPYYHSVLPVSFDDTGDDLFLIWPAIIVHVIDESSPFYKMGANDLLKEKFEIVAILEGTVESTGQSVQARTSYLPSELLWGHRFEQLIKYRPDTGQYMVDYGKFNNTYEVETPVCSSEELQRQLKKEFAGDDDDDD